MPGYMEAALRLQPASRKVNEARSGAGILDYLLCSVSHTLQCGLGSAGVRLRHDTLAAGCCVGEGDFGKGYILALKF